MRLWKNPTKSLATVKMLRKNTLIGRSLLTSTCTTLSKTYLSTSPLNKPFDGMLVPAQKSTKVLQIFLEPRKKLQPWKKPLTQRNLNLQKPLQLTCSVQWEESWPEESLTLVLPAQCWEPPSCEY